MLKKRLMALVLIAGASMATTLLQAPAAHAAGPAASCDVQIGKTSKSGSYIVGHGSLSNCPASSTAHLIIQEYRGFVLGWDDKASGTAHQGYDTAISYNCSGTGTQTWRTLITTQTIGGTYLTKASNQIRVSC
jgi:hypothetical protein